MENTEENFKSSVVGQQIQLTVVAVVVLGSNPSVCIDKEQNYSETEGT